jgi:S1 RNA binding domain protein
MELEIGSVLAGKVTGITKFGAFVSVPPGRTGLVHISEIAGSFVNDVSEHLSVGQEVTVKVIGMEGGKLNLSIKAALTPEQLDRREPAQRDTRPREPKTREMRQREARGPARERERETAPRESGPPREPASGAPDAGSSFEDRLQKFMKDADNKISGIRQFSDKRGSRRRGGGGGK